jgi:hypothetical protein
VHHPLRRVRQACDRERLHEDRRRRRQLRCPVKDPREIRLLTLEPHAHVRRVVQRWEARRDRFEVHSRCVNAKELRQVPRQHLVGLCHLSLLQKEPVAVDELHFDIEIVDARVREVEDVVELKRELEHQRLWRFDSF